MDESTSRGGGVNDGAGCGAVMVTGSSAGVRLAQAW
jgi:hypothetical protein